MGAYPTTHVANGCPYPIWAMCDTDRQHTIDATAKFEVVSIGINQSDIRSTAIEAGLTKINPGEYLGFKPKIGLGGANWINRNTVYITVVYEKDTQMQPVCKAFPKASNESIIIAKDCTIRATKMGELWIDTNGKNHKP